jgi:hypothetical protein
MNRKRLILFALLAASLLGTSATWRRLSASDLSAPAVEAVDALAAQALRYRQAQPHHWRGLMLRQ